MSVNLEKLGKILALAETSSFPEERDAFMQKAQEVAATLGVELAVARAHHADKTKREVPEKRKIKVGNERSKKNDYLVQLFLAIAHPHDVIVTIGWKNLYCDCYGLPSDIAIVEALFGMSVFQMISDANEAIAQGLQKTAGYHGRPIDGRIYRAHFYEGFISKLTTRLWTARRDAIRAQGRQSEANDTGTEIVLREKKKEVEDFYEEEAKHWLHTGTWEPPQRNDYVADAVNRGEKSASNLNLNLSDKVKSGTKLRLDKP